MQKDSAAHRGEYRQAAGTAAVRMLRADRRVAVIRSRDVGGRWLAPPRPSRYPHASFRVTGAGPVLLGSTGRLLASLMHGQALPLGNEALELLSFPGVLSLSREGQSFFSAPSAFFGSHVCRL
jgi:hypothetical protein